MNSSGNICIMNYKEGDIIIDFGYTKNFYKMGKEDSRTWRYIENIVGFLSSSNAHMIYYNGQTAKNYRPKGVGFETDINI